MFKRLFSSSGEIQKVFSECRIDSSHEMVNTKKMIELALRYLGEGEQRRNIHININIHHNSNNNINININNNSKEGKQRQQRKQQLIEAFNKKLHSRNLVQIIKTLIAAHAIFKKVQEEMFVEALLKELQELIVDNRHVEEKEQMMTEGIPVEVKLESTKEDFMQRNIVSFYCFYLKKFILSFDTFVFAKNYANGKISQSQNVIETINHGFVVLNLVNYILKSQQTFNKMGRYYLPHKELLSLFLKYLQDLTVYNAFIKKLTSLSLTAIKEAGGEEVRHHFLFVTEAQKTSDRLYQFFYNRYYYNEVKNIVFLPTFLSIHADDYKELVNEVKKKDRELVVLVKKSKYEIGNGRSVSCAFKTTRTDQDEQFDHVKSVGNSLNCNAMSLCSVGDVETKKGGSTVSKKRYKSSYKS